MKAYTNQQKRKAVALAQRLGPSKAAQKLDLPSGTLSCWAHKARVAAREGTEWPGPQGRTNRPEKGPALVAVEVRPETETGELDNSEPAWELESPHGTVLRVRTALSVAELQQVLLAMAVTEASS